MSFARHAVLSGAVIAGSFLVADTTNAIIAAAFPLARPAAPASGAARMPAPAVVRSLDYFLGPIVRKNVFLHGEPIPGEEPQVEPVATAASEPCTLPLEILGSVVVPRDPSLSVVSVRDVATKKIHVLQVGDVFLETALAEVSAPFDDETMRKRTIAVFEHPNGAREACRSGDKPTRPGVAVASASAPTGEGITRVADGQYEIPRAEIDAVLNGGLATIATTVRIVPYFEGGKSAGFKIYSLKPGSLLTKLGLINGDVLKRVNGYEISSPEKALEVYGMLKSERNLALDVTRAGKPKTLSYAIR